MLYTLQSEEASIRSGDKSLSRHIETWGPRTKSYVGGDGWSQLSYDSSELGNVASPFDDIGFLAGGTGGMDTATKSTMNLNATTEQPTDPATPSLGAFLETTKSDGLQAIEEQPPMQQDVSRRTSRRLDKTISKREHFQDEEASLALSAAMAGGDKTKGTRNLFEFSKASLGLSVLSGPKPRPKNNEDSKSLFGASKSSVTKPKGKGHDSSRSSFGFGASRNSEGSRTIGSKFSSMMRSKNDNNDKLMKSEERVTMLESENQQLAKENNLLQAKLAEMADLVEKQNAVKDWRNIEELANSTAEMWKYRSMFVLANLEVEQLKSQLASYEHLVEAKERSICNLEDVRNKQEKRIGYLEVQCLQNGVDIAEEGSVAPIKLIEEAPLKGDDDDTGDNENSFASFQDDDDVPFRIDYSPAQLEKLIKAKRSRDEDNDHLGKSHRSESSNSIGVSDLSGHDEHSEGSPDEPETKQNSWLAPTGGEAPRSSSVKVKVRSNDVNANGVALENYLAAAEPRQHCLETGTWDPTKMLDFEMTSPRDVGVIPPPPPPPPSADHVHSAPAPSSRKSAPGASTVVSRSTRSKSPGMRRRLKDPRGENDPLGSVTVKVEQGARRSKSPGTRRRLKDPAAAAASTTATNLGASSSSLTMGSGHRRKLKAAASFNKEMDRTSLSHGDKARRKRDTGLDAGSTHSLGRGSAHRRRQRKESEFDRQTVSTALENALGRSLNVLDMDDDFLHLIAPPGASVSKPVLSNKDLDASVLVRSKASKEDDIGFADLDLDAIFKE